MPPRLSVPSLLTRAALATGCALGFTAGCASHAASATPAAQHTAAATPQTPPDGPVAERAQAIYEAASTLGKADAARKAGNRSFAEQLFSSAEILVGPQALDGIAPLFREGAPPRITTPLKQLPMDSQAQPLVSRSSDEDEPPVPLPKRGGLSGTLQLGGKALAGRGVVTIEPVGSKWKPRPPRDRVMEQRNRSFAPRMLVVRKGSTVTFPNFDTVYHNVFSRSDAASFDLGIYKNGQTRELVFDKPGIVHVGCNLHANMAGYIVVVDSPHYAVTDENGAFSFKSLAPGKYRMHVYTERSASPIEQDVTVTADTTSTATVAIVGDAVPPSIDKFGKPRGK